MRMTDLAGSAAGRRVVGACLSLLVLLRVALWIQGVSIAQQINGSTMLERVGVSAPRIDLLRLTAVVVVPLLVSLAVIVLTTTRLKVWPLFLVVGAAYAASTFFGPARWAPDPGVDVSYVFEDTAGYASMLAIELVLAGALLALMVTVERKLSARPA